MKTKQIIKFALLAIIFSACKGESVPKSNSNKINIDEASDYRIDESGVNLKIPKEYALISIPEYVELIKFSDWSKEIKENQYKIMENIDEKFPNFDLLIDTITLQNLIWIIRTGPYIELSKESVKLAVQLFTRENSLNDLIISKEELIEKKLVTRNNFKYIKLKLKQNYIHGVRFFSHYLISTNNHTFGLSFMTIEKSDFQEYVNLIQVK